jgi:protein-disulfide isomerase
MLKIGYPKKVIRFIKLLGNDKGMVDENMEEHLSEKIKKSKKSNIWMYSTIALIIILAIVVAVFLLNRSTGMVTATMAKEAAAQKAVDYVKNNLGAVVTVSSVEEMNNFYKINGSVQGSPVTFYTTKDGGHVIIGNVFDTSVKRPTQTEKNQPSADIPKSDKPTVELFVMSHCPYGTQIEKGILPVVELLGDKIDFELKFVDYAMHGEKEVNEETRQVCIQKEQPDKYINYLKCFLGSDDYQKCLIETSIDINKLDACIESLDDEFKITELLNDKSTWSGGRYPQFNVYKNENNKYGVQGSPTLVINEKVVSSGRDSASLLEIICSAFNEAPEECNQQLSSESPSPGFGYTASGSGSSGSCA